MADFDWNQYQAEAPFDWDQFEADGNVSPPKASTNQMDSATRGALQGATLGLRDELAGAIESPFGAGKAILEKFGGDYAADPDVVRYKAERDASQALDEAAEKENPWSYLGGMVGGGLALPVAAAAALPAGIAGALGAGGTFGAVAGAGALSGAGFSKADSLGGLAADTALGGLTGAATYGLGKAIPAAAGKLGEYTDAARGAVGGALKSGAEKLANKAVGAGRSGDDDIGRYLLDKGLIRAGDSTDDIARRTSEAITSSGNEIGEILKNLEGKGAKVSVDKIVESLDEKIAKLNETPGNEKLVKALEKEVNSLIGRGESDISPVIAEEAKRAYQSQTNYNSPNHKRKASSYLADEFRTQTESAAEEFPELASAFKEQKSTYGRLAPVVKDLQKKSQDSLLNSGDLLAGAAGSAIGGNPGAILAPVAKRLVADRALSTGAAALDKGAKVLLGADNIQSIAPRMGKYGKVLTDAANRSEKSLASTHFLLNKTDPEYRQQLREALGEEQ